MFFILSRIFVWVAEPLTYIILALLAAIFLPVRFKKIRISCPIIAILLTVVFTNPLLYTHAERSWQATTHDIQDTTHYRYGVVLGGFGQFDSYSHSIDYQRAIDRLFTAVRYYRDGRIDYIIVSGDGLTTDSATFYREMEQLYNIPPHVLIREPLARSTRENAQYVAEIVRQHNNLPIAVFTSAIHVPRSKLAFEQEGIDAVFIPSDYRSRKDNIYNMWMPSPKVLIDWGELIHEWIGYITYKISK